MEYTGRLVKRECGTNADCKERILWYRLEFNRGPGPTHSRGRPRASSARADAARGCFSTMLKYCGSPSRRRRSTDSILGLNLEHNDCARTAFTGSAESVCDARRESCSKEFQPAHPRRRTYRDSRAERLRQVNSDQDHNA